MTTNERNSNGTGVGDGGSGGERGDFGSEGTTKVDSPVGADVDTIARARADALIFDRVASPLDALADALGTLESDLARLAPVRRLRALDLMIEKLGHAGECIYETRHDLIERRRIEVANGTNGETK